MTAFFNAVVGVRAAGFEGWQSPTTLLTAHIFLQPLLLVVGVVNAVCHPHKHTTTVESGCSDDAIFFIPKFHQGYYIRLPKKPKVYFRLQSSHLFVAKVTTSTFAP